MARTIHSGGFIAQAEIDAIDEVAVKRVLGGERVELTRAEHNRVYLELIALLYREPPRVGGWSKDGRREDPRVALAAQGLGMSVKGVRSYISRLRRRIAERGGVANPQPYDSPYCGRGLHEMAGDNVYVSPDGKRRCRACRKATAGKRSSHNALKTHCPSGHRYDEANTRHYKGRRYCLECRRDRDWAKYTPTGNGNKAKTVCIAGHAFTPENTYTTKDGRRQCRQCRRDRQRGYYEARETG